jgi:rhodanese-related sulfurtransferase
MRQLGLGFALVLALGVLATGTPVLGVDTVTYDFGSVAEGTVVTHTFVLTNRGDETLTITGTRASCGCTTTALSKSSLAPGESVTLEARVDTSHFGGRIVKQIYIESNDPTAATAVVYVQGDVTPLQPYNITLGDLKYLFFLIIDVRSPAAYATGHLLGAVSIPSANLPLWIGILPRDVILVLYDDTGTDSAVQAKYLQGAGFPQARSLAGGLAGWSLIPSAASYVSGTLPTLTAPAPAALQSYEIGNADLRSLYLIVIDVRTPADYASRGGHFMGAVNIPASELPAWQTKLPKDVEIVLYDQTGTEGDRLAQVLQTAGLGKVRSLAGGYDAWVRSYGITFLIAERP